jgi:NADH-quinone oxidoreductase subunit J
MTGSLFYFFAFVTLFMAVLVVTSKSPVYSVIFLILTFFSLSVHYILLNAQFLAAVNLIVYAGAIMVLFLFVIMFLNLKSEQALKTSNIAKVAAAISGGLLMVLMVSILKDADTGAFDPNTYNSQIGMVENLGKVLFRDYLLPFELASILFLAAMVGAVMLGKKEAHESHF